MAMSLTDYRAEFRERLLDLLWRQWSALGVAAQVTPWQRAPLDPEALLAISCTVARHDARLFDALLEWLRINGRYVNVQRIRRMFGEHAFAGGNVYAAVAAVISNATRSLKWTRSTRPMGPQSSRQEPLFYLPNGEPLPVVHSPDPRFLAYGLLRDRYEPRSTAQPFPPESPVCVLLRLRALLGVSARCEILAYLLLNRKGSPRAIARACGYYPATIIKALAEMADSGYVVSRARGRQRQYSLIPDEWRTLLLEEEPPPWVIWRELYGALEEAWSFLHEPERDGQPPLAQASALRRVMRSRILEALSRSELPVVLDDDSHYPGESLLLFFIERMRQVLAAVDELGRPREGDFHAGRERGASGEA